MDRAAMQNLFLYGNQGQGQGGQGQGQGQGGQNQGQGQGQGGGNEQQPNDQQGGLDAQAAQALGVAGYPALMQQYLLQQQQQQQQQAAAGMDPRFAGLGGAGGYNNYGAPQGMMHNQGMGGQGMGQGMGNGMSQNSMSQNGMSQNGMSQNGMSQGGGHMMDSNLLLMQRFQQQQHQQQQHQQQQQQQLQQQPTGQWIGDMSGEGDPYAESGILGPWSATSAGLLGKMASNAPTETKTKKVRKKPKDRPKRPLSAYNIFFKEERARILEEIPTEKDEKESGKDESKEKDEKVEKVEEEQEPPADGSKPIRKRKKLPHGKIGFESLAKVIGQRWQDLESDEVKYYKDKAEEDMKRYKIEMEVYLSKQAEAKKGMDASNADGEGEKDLDEKPSKKAKTESSSAKEVESTAAI